MTLTEFYGQCHILAPGKMLQRMIVADQLASIILFGPPGTGKTSLAKIVANSTNRSFSQLNAVTAGIADIKAIVSDCQNKLLNPSGRILLFIDEIHRFNKVQQDALLPFVENGSITLIGATTENPYFKVNKALVSRSTVFQLYPLSAGDIKNILKQALQNVERGLGRLDIRIAEPVLDFIADLANGDARIALNGLELAVITTPIGADGSLRLDLDTLKDCMQKRSPAYDRDGENHYDCISAFIKSVRGSHPDAALLYLGKMLQAGEEPEFIARRMLVLAAEDIGLANPQLLNICQATYQAVSILGMPEARIVLAETCILLALSPKSNSAYLAIEKALSDVAQRNTGEIPLHLRNAVTEGMAELGYGKDYIYAHSAPGHIVNLDYMPPQLKGTVYYEAGQIGYEKKLNDWLLEWRQKHGITV